MLVVINKLIWVPSNMRFGNFSNNFKVNRIASVFMFSMATHYTILKTEGIATKIFISHHRAHNLLSN